MYSRLKEDADQSGFYHCDSNDPLGDMGSEINETLGFDSSVVLVKRTEPYAASFESTPDGAMESPSVSDCSKIKTQCTNFLLKSSVSAAGDDPWNSAANENTRISGSTSLGSMVDPWAPQPSSQRHDQRYSPTVWLPENTATRPGDSNDPWLPPPASSSVVPVTLCQPALLESPVVDCFCPVSDTPTPVQRYPDLSAVSRDNPIITSSVANDDQSVHSFLDANSKLVNLDNLTLSTRPDSVNPFSPGASSRPPGANPFHQMSSSVSMNQLKSQMQEAETVSQRGACGSTLIPQSFSTSPTTNPLTTRSEVLNPFLI